MMSAAGGEGLDVNDVYSTTIYRALDNGTNVAVTNGVDLSTDGCMLWSKSYQYGFYGVISDTETGITNNFQLDSTTNPLDTNGDSLGRRCFHSVQTDGFTYGTGHTGTNGASQGEYVVSCFKRNAKFFDVVTYTGNGSSQNISHNLGSTPGFIIVKASSTSGYGWSCYHRGANGGTNPHQYPHFFSSYSAEFNNTNYWGSGPTSTQFSVGSNGNVNANGVSYVAYLFAHNDGDGDFGPTGDQDIIKCGYYTGDGSEYPPKKINIGFEPQFIMIKQLNTNSEWYRFDEMRGNFTGKFPSSTKNYYLTSGDSSSETYGAYFRVDPDGISIYNNSGVVNNNGSKYAYVAIRRGSLFPPTAVSEVFDIDDFQGSVYPRLQSDFYRVDMAIYKDINDSKNIQLTTRNTQYAFDTHLDTNTSSAEADGGDYSINYKHGFGVGNVDYGTNVVGWMWKKAPHFFDIACYQGNSTSGRTVPHNLGIAPEMMWVKQRTGNGNWICFHKALGNTKYLSLNQTWSEATFSGMWNDTSPTDTEFTLGNNTNVNNGNANDNPGQHYIALLFGSVDGISKVGSYSGSSSPVTVTCGFNPRFVMLKVRNDTGGWIFVDTFRGIANSSGNDPFLAFSSNAAQNSNNDIIDTTSTGFTVKNAGDGVNAANKEYIFYAIA